MFQVSLTFCVGQLFFKQFVFFKEACHGFLNPSYKAEMEGINGAILIHKITLIVKCIIVTISMTTLYFFSNLYFNFFTFYVEVKTSVETINLNKSILMNDP